MTSYLQGKTLTITATFTVGGEETDPSTIELWTLSPAGEVETYTYETPSDPPTEGAMVRVSEGVYRQDVLFGEAGTWYLEWRGTGDAPTVGELSVTIDRSRFAG